MVDTLVFEHGHFHRFRYCVIAMLSPRYRSYWVLKVRRCPLTVGNWYTKHEPSSTDSFLTKLMVYTINTGCLTRYSCFQLNPYLDSYFVQFMFNDSLDYSNVPIFDLIYHL